MCQNRLKFSPEVWLLEPHLSTSNVVGPESCFGFGPGVALRVYLEIRTEGLFEGLGFCPVLVQGLEPNLVRGGTVSTPSS